MPDSKGIFWAVIDEHTQRWLQRQALFPKVFGRHIMLYFNVPYSTLKSWDGYEFSFSIPLLAWNNRVQAVSVILPANVPRDYPYPHITVSAQKGVSPVASNDMLKAVHKEVRLLNSMVNGEARITFFEFETLPFT